MRAAALLAALLAACSTLQGAGRDDCYGSEEQCAQTAAVRAWWSDSVLGYDDDEPLRTEWTDGDVLPAWCGVQSGVAHGPHRVEVASARALCHEVVHVQLWRLFGDPCAEHAPECAWGAAAWATEDACKDAAAPP